MKVQIKVKHIGGKPPVKPQATKPAPKLPTRTEVKNAVKAQDGHAKFAADHKALAAEAEDVGDDAKAAVHLATAKTHEAAAAAAAKIVVAGSKK